MKVDYPMIDRDNPFKYSVQNAYDGNRSTSYVEDSENDLFEIEFLHYYYKSKFQDDTFVSFKVINGYASTYRLYSENNRISQFVIDEEDKNGDRNILCSFDCADDSLDFQNFTIPNGLFYFGIRANKIFKGSKYSDTSLAEIDFCGKNNGWFFDGTK